MMNTIDKSKYLKHGTISYQKDTKKCTHTQNAFMHFTKTCGTSCYAQRTKNSKVVFQTKRLG